LKDVGNQNVLVNIKFQSMEDNNNTDILTKITRGLG